MFNSVKSKHLHFENYKYFLFLSKVYLDKTLHKTFLSKLYFYMIPHQFKLQNPYSKTFILNSREIFLLHVEELYAPCANSSFRLNFRRLLLTSPQSPHSDKKNLTRKVVCTKFFPCLRVHKSGVVEI